MASTSGGGDGVVTVKMAADGKSYESCSGGVIMAVKKLKRERGSTAKERISKMPPCTAGKRSSIYRGVTRHRWTGRYEAHLWDKSTWNQNQNKKGKQVYLGAYDDEEAAARAYDLAALKYWGAGTLINFPVTDYSRDLEEMQNLSREEYLASLRRKSSGFSRGLAKYRALSSRWEPLLGRTTGADYLHGIHYGKGDNASAEGEYLSGSGFEKKIDLTGHIKWWGGDKVDTHTRSKHVSSEEVSSELKSLERGIQSTEPYQMPQLGTTYEAKKSKGSAVSVLSILSRSAAYKDMQEKALKINATVNDNDNEEKENKSNISRIDLGKAIEKTSEDSGTERLESTLGMLHKSMFPLSPLLTAQLFTNHNTMDPLADPVLWSSLMPMFPPAPSRTSEVTKTETSSTYGFFRQEEG